MSITVTLTPATRSGICSLPLAALATESVTFTGADLADGVIVTVMQPDGTPVAIGTVASGAALLDLNTKESHRATIALPVGATTKVFLVIGDTDALRFVVPALIQRNYLDDVIPPTAEVPFFPSKEELDAILVAANSAAERAEGYAEDAWTEKDLAVSAKTDAQLAANNASGSAFRAEGYADNAESYYRQTLQIASDASTQIQQQVIAARDYASAAATSATNAEDFKTQAEGAARVASTAKGVATTMRNEALGFRNEAEGFAAAASEAVGQVEGAVTAAETALQGKVDAATESIAQSTETATTAAEDAAKAKKEAEDAEAGAEAAKEAAETALNNGCIYQVREVDSSAITLDKTLTAYKHTPTADTAYTFATPAEAEGKIIVFWLWVVMGATPHQLTFPSTVTWIAEGSFAANTETLLAFMSTDGGATWQANLQWEKAVAA